MEKDPLLDELADAIAQGPVIFTPDDSWEEKFEEVKYETKKYSVNNQTKKLMKSKNIKLYWNLQKKIQDQLFFLLHS